MSEQRFRNLESGGSVRITEAVMRGSGPQGPKGDRGPSGPATVIKGRRPYNEITGMRGEPGDAWIADNPTDISTHGHLFAWDEVVFINDKKQDPWADLGKIVGPAGDTHSLGAQLSTQRERYVEAGGKDSLVVFDNVDYNDTEPLTDAAGEIVQNVPLIDMLDTPSTYWSYGDRSLAESMYSADPVHLIHADIIFTATVNQEAEGHVTLRLYKRNPDGEWGSTGISASEYFESNKGTPRQSVSLTWVGKTDPDELYQLRVNTDIGGYVSLARMQTARVGGVAGPAGPTGPQGDRGEPGKQGIQGPPGTTAIPTGCILPFAGNPLFLYGNYETEQDASGNEVPVIKDGNRVPAAIPAFQLCDGRNVHQSTQLYLEHGMIRTPDLRGRFLMGATEDQHNEVEAPPENYPNIQTWGPHVYSNTANADFYAGSDILNDSHLPGHTHELDGNAYNSTEKKISLSLDKDATTTLNWYHNHGSTGTPDQTLEHDHSMKHLHHYYDYYQAGWEKERLVQKNDDKDSKHTLTWIQGRSNPKSFKTTTDWAVESNPFTNSFERMDRTGPGLSKGNIPHKHAVGYNDIASKTHEIKIPLDHTHADTLTIKSNKTTAPTGHQHKHVVMAYYIKT